VSTALVLRSRRHSAVSLVDLVVIKEHRQEQLNSYLEHPFQGLAPLRLLSQGDPAIEIVQFAKREQVSIVAMPTRGVGVFRRMLLGSVTAKVLHDAPCPVWTSSHTEHATEPSYPYRTVGCALDLSERSEDTLRWAYQFASQQNARLEVIHAIDVDEECTSRGVLEVRRYLRGSTSNKWQELEKELGLTTPLHIAYGSVGAAVRKAVHDLQADIVIIGRRHIQERVARLRTKRLRSICFWCAPTVRSVDTRYLALKR
jgi:nucleotide-binding universal stress UspA family protein